MSAPVIVTSPEELARIVREAMKSAPIATAQDEVLKPPQVCKLLGCSQPTLRKFIENGLPAHTGDRFLRSEVLAWVASTKAKPRKRSA